MKATINELWQTGREIICYDDSEFDSISVRGMESEGKPVNGTNNQEMKLAA